jgi:hypothetical protein
VPVAIDGNADQSREAAGDTIQSVHFRNLSHPVEKKETRAANVDCGTSGGISHSRVHPFCISVSGEQFGPTSFRPSRFSEATPRESRGVAGAAVTFLCARAAGIGAVGKGLLESLDNRNQSSGASKIP